jgi:Xaa-Pro aminopeptidase
VYLWFGTDGQRFCLVPALDEEYAQAQGIDAEIVSYFEYPGVESPESHLAAELSRRGRGTARIGFSAGVTLATAEKLRAAMPDAAFTTTSAVATMRLRKHPEEIAFHRQAAEVCDLMLASGRSLIEERIAASAPLPTEGELARHVISFGTDAMYDRYEHVIYTTKLAGGLVYAGPNSARPHGLPSSRRLEIGDTLILSLGAAVASRFVESERTFIIGEPSKEQALYFMTALRAQEAGTQALHAGRPCADANALCLAVIEDAGFGRFIRHRQGHGIGIAQHEPPWLEAGDDTVLAPGMIVSSEPGIYVPGHAGYRISDSVLITETAPERLTSYPRSLEQNVIPV